MFSNNITGYIKRMSVIVFWSIEMVSHTAEWRKGNIDEKELQGDRNGESTFGKKKRQA